MAKKSDGFFLCKSVSIQVVQVVRPLLPEETSSTFYIYFLLFKVVGQVGQSGYSLNIKNKNRPTSRFKLRTKPDNLDYFSIIISSVIVK